MAVEIRDLTKSYGADVAVRSVSLSVQEGEFVSLVGPSGCGKTTILRSIAGFVRPDNGRIWIRGQDVTHLPPYKRSAGMVFQNYALFPHMTVKENIAFGLKMHGASSRDISERVASTIRLVRLEGLSQRYPAQLSGGQQQRVALARVLAFGPSVLLLDEPFSALDRKLREDMQVELKLLQKKVGITTVFVTHDQEEALTMSDRIAVMNKGVIEQFDTPTSVYEKPATEFVARFLGTTNIIEGHVTAISGDSCTVRTANGKQIITVAQAQPDSKGVPIKLTLRPEKIKIFATEDGTSQFDNTIDTRIETVVYKGNLTHYYCQWDEDKHIIVSAQNADGRSNGSSFQPGQAVRLGWNRSDIIPIRTID